MGQEINWKITGLPETETGGDLKVSNKQVIVVGGKGGVGKTAMSAIIAKLLIKANRKILVIDADPVISLAFSLGEKPGRTIGDLRERIIEVPSEKRKMNERPIKKTIKDLVAVSDKGFSLLTMGRAEGPGCFCALNELLRYGIESLSKDFDVTLIDCEAGVEQVNRRVIHEIDKLIMVTDTSIRGIETAFKVMEIAKKYCRKIPHFYLVVNRLKDSQVREHLKCMANKNGLNIVGFVPEDINVESYNLKGVPMIDLPDNSPSVMEMKNILNKLELI